jgi:hypothetical protein
MGFEETMEMGNQHLPTSEPPLPPKQTFIFLDIHVVSTRPALGIRGGISQYNVHAHHHLRCSFVYLPTTSPPAASAVQVRTAACT